MRKGIVATIIIFTLVLIISLFIIQVVYSSTSYMPRSNTLTLIRVASTIIFPSIGLILLGFHLNKKFGKHLSYWRFVFNGITVSIFSILIYHTGLVLIRYFLNETFLPSAFETMMYSTLFKMALFIIYCLIIGLFYKKMKFRKKTEALDSNIVND